MIDTGTPPALMTVTGSHGAPSLADAAKQLGVPAADVDASYGVVPIDPERGLYAVQVRSGKPASQPPAAAQFRGPWSNPRIVPFGPVQDGDPKK